MQPQICSHRDLTLWQLGMEIAERIYRVTRDFPTDERFGLVAQLRRAAVSVPANIAEGNARSRRRSICSFSRLPSDPWQKSKRSLTFPFDSPLVSRIRCENWLI
jgi:hypothetical protein